jgi:hypothetical protein
MAMHDIDERRRVEKLIHDHREDGNQTAHSVWFRGPHTNRAPKMPAMIPQTAVLEHVLRGWAPDRPAIDRDTRITAFGSCFAANISKHLGRRNYRVSAQDPDAQKAYVVEIGEGMVNSFVIRQQFEWAWEGRSFDQPLWHGYDASEFAYDEEVRATTKRLFDATDVFILTFGLSEVWYDEPTGEVFWRTIPKDVYDPERHRFRVSGVEENRANIEAIYRLIRTHRPDAKVIVTLSPIPLIATFRDTSCITANSVSKSVLRVAIDEVMRAHRDEGQLFYWPSYEIAMDVFRAPFIEDRRHLPHPVLDFIMAQFEHVWCVDEDDARPSLRLMWLRALAASGIVHERIGRFVDKRRADKLREAAEREQHADAEVDAAFRMLLREAAAEIGGM